MPGKCDICGKDVEFGNAISHAHNVTRRKWYPNLQRVRAEVNGKTVKLYVCTRCLRSGKVQKAVKKSGTDDKPAE